ncbi:M23 family metallopeptidase [Actinoplanes sp. G11-F43]|uniref:M23 family metallopeptidase n=1 Tax=Actinoplanes sp. G11-F43 TaxID=3424130 RepID=UPI003D32BD14
MKRAIARHQTLWLRLFIITVIVTVVMPYSIPLLLDLLISVVPLALAFVRAPRSKSGPVELAPPVRGRWVAVNSPGTVVPSHGIRAYGQTYAVDLIMPSAEAPAKIGWSPRTRPPESFVSFGVPVLAMAAGRVVRATDSQRDHGSRDTWPSLIWMTVVEALIRELAGVDRILGNHVIVEHEDGTFAAYAHLRHSSLKVSVGDQVAEGQQLAEVGNTGNTSEPHLHVQLMDSPHLTAAAGIPMLWPAIEPEAEKDPRWSTGEPKPTAVAGFPENGRVFEATEVTTG